MKDYIMPVGTNRSYYEQTDGTRKKPLFLQDPNHMYYYDSYILLTTSQQEDLHR